MGLDMSPLEIITVLLSLVDWAGYEEEHVATFPFLG